MAIPESGWCIVVDLNKCVGCQACAVVCKTWWNKDNSKGRHHIWWLIVETRPGTGYPRNWLEKSMRGEMPSKEDYEQYTEFKYEDLRNNPTSSIPPNITPEPAPTWGPNWDWDTGSGEEPSNAWFFYLPMQCMHCDDAPCVNSCPTNAMYKRDDGIVVYDPQLCMACRACFESCPYRRIFWDEKNGVPSKCILCLPFVERGEPPLCIRTCPAKARFFGRLDDPESPVYVIVKEYKAALPLLPEFNTNPRILYIPPVLIPPRPDGTPRYDKEYLEKLFGKDVWRVKEVLEAERKKGMNSKLIRVLTGYPTYKVR